MLAGTVGCSCDKKFKQTEVAHRPTTGKFGSLNILISLWETSSIYIQLTDILYAQ
jgi:hypothetical protein